MDDDAFADNIYIGTRADFPEIRRQSDAASAVFADGDIADVSEMEFTDSPFSVCDTRRIPVPTGGRAVGCTTITTCVDMDGVETRRCACISMT